MAVISNAGILTGAQSWGRQTLLTGAPTPTTHEIDLTPGVGKVSIWYHDSNGIGGTVAHQKRIGPGGNDWSTYATDAIPADGTSVGHKLDMAIVAYRGLLTGNGMVVLGEARASGGPLP